MPRSGPAALMLSCGPAAYLGSGLLQSGSVVGSRRCAWVRSRYSIGSRDARARWYLGGAQFHDSRPCLLSLGRPWLITCLQPFSRPTPAPDLQLLMPSVGYRLLLRPSARLPVLPAPAGRGLCVNSAPPRVGRAGGLVPGSRRRLEPAVRKCHWDLFTSAAPAAARGSHFGRVVYRTRGC